MTWEGRAEFLTRSIESHNHQLGELNDRLRVTMDAIETLVRVTNEDSINIRALARIAESHERRITDIEADGPDRG